MFIISVQILILRHPQRCQIYRKCQFIIFCTNKEHQKLLKQKIQLSLDCQGSSQPTSALKSHSQNAFQKTLLTVPVSPSLSCDQLAEAFLFLFIVSLIISRERHKGELVDRTKNKLLEPIHSTLSHCISPSQMLIHKDESSNKQSQKFAYFNRPARLKCKTHDKKQYTCKNNPFQVQKTSSILKAQC